MTTFEDNFARCVCYRLGYIPISSVSLSYSQGISLPLSGYELPYGFHEKVVNFRVMLNGDSPLDGEMFLMISPFQIGDKLTSRCCGKGGYVRPKGGVVSYLNEFDVTDIPECRVKDIQDGLLVRYKLSHRSLKKGTSVCSNLVLTFMYTVIHISDKDGKAYWRNPMGTVMFVTRIYRLKLIGSTTATPTPIRLDFLSFNNSLKVVSCCITDSMMVSRPEDFTTICTLTQPAGDQSMTYDNGDQLYMDYVQNCRANAVYFHLRVMQRTCADNHNTNEDESSFFVTVNDNTVGGELIVYMVDTNGLTVPDYLA
jgi:hypothetical protein